MNNQTPLLVELSKESKHIISTNPVIQNEMDNLCKAVITGNHEEFASWLSEIMSSVFSVTAKQVLLRYVTPEDWDKLVNEALDYQIDKSMKDLEKRLFNE